MTVLFALGSVGWVIFSLQDAALTGVRATQVVLAENAVFGVLKLLLLVALAGLLPVTGVLLAWVAPMLLALVPVNVALFRRLRRNSGQAHSHRPEVLRFLGWEALGLAFSQLYTSAILMIAFAGHGAEATAPFAICWTVTLALDMVAHNLGSPLTVEGSRDPGRIGQYTRSVFLRGMGLTLSLAVAAAVGVWIVGTGVLGPGYEDVQHLLPIMLLGNGARLINYLYQARCRAEGRPARIAFNQIATGLVTAALTVWAVGHGLTSVALASGVGPLLVALTVLRPLLRTKAREPQSN